MQLPKLSDDEIISNPQNSSQSVLNLGNKRVIRPNLQDLLPYLHLSQKQAAENFGMSTSELCKLWKKWFPNYRWPQRAFFRINKDETSTKAELQERKICKCVYDARIFSLGVERQARLMRCSCTKKLNDASSPSAD
eukprot:TRINITY_DN21252_c0_g1_i1.p1 TRINITY_DN21252_c0_g1~~TRINITY_DN21252_c0_g1_i1.p1  ORF type:complete len:136 (+),score=22.75 TRINITY_DN21252_c0_g1_i1:176-583(+)